MKFLDRRKYSGTLASSLELACAYPDMFGKIGTGNAADVLGGVWSTNIILVQSV
jgi:hypothetical protein